MRIISYIIFFLLFIIGFVFAILNHGKVEFDYYFGYTQISLSLLLVYALGTGILLGFFGAISYWLKLKAENYRLKKQLSNCNNQ